MSKCYSFQLTSFSFFLFFLSFFLFSFFIFRLKSFVCEQSQKQKLYAFLSTNFSYKIRIAPLLISLYGSLSRLLPHEPVDHPNGRLDIRLESRGVVHQPRGGRGRRTVALVPVTQHLHRRRVAESLPSLCSLIILFIGDHLFVHASSADASGLYGRNKVRR